MMKRSNSKPKAGVFVKNWFATAILLCIVNCVANAQPIVSIGDIRIGMTEDQFLRLPEIKSKKMDDIGYQEYQSRKNLHLRCNTCDLDDDLWKKTTDSRVPEIYQHDPKYWKIFTPGYVIYEFSLATGIKNDTGKDTYKATLDFYQGELIKIKLDISNSISEFKDILIEKYGRPTIKDSTKNVICQNGYGAKSVHKYGDMSWNWEGKGQIKAMLMSSISGCGKYAEASYTIHHSAKILFLNKLERKALKNLEREEIKLNATSSKL